LVILVVNIIINNSILCKANQLHSVCLVRDSSSLFYHTLLIAQEVAVFVFIVFKRPVDIFRLFNKCGDI
jgi:hypothetical protein